jgi:flagellar hook-associated protein 2
MSISTNLISGLSSGFDWRSMIDQLIAIDRGRVDLIEGRKSEYESQLAEWQNVNTMLLSLKTASGALSTESAFNVYTSGTTSSSETGTPTAASSLLTVSTNTSVSPGLYNIEVNNLAQSEKISSTNYAATDTALGLIGDILVSGNVVNIVSTDTLADVKDKINSVNTGSDPSNVTASIVSHSSTNYHLVMTSDNTGEDGLNILEGAYDSGDNILEEMGFISGSTTIKNTTSDGAKSDLFDSSSGAIKTLLGLTSAPGATIVKIGGLDVSIDLSSAAESLTTIAQKIDVLAGISAEVVSETVSGETKYRIDISGTTSFAENVGGNGNVLQTLGILEGTYGTVAEVHAGTVVIQDATDTALEGAPATLMTDLKIGGSSASVVNGDKITISGTKHDGTAATTTEFIVDTGNADHDCIDDLITHIQTAFGATVTASFSGGKLIITDTTAGDSQLEVSIICDNAGGGTLNFGAISMTTEGRSRQVAAGEDAEIVVDNVTITNSSNTIEDVIAGATLNLVGEDSDTTVTLKIERDLASIKSKIEDMVSAYNSIMDYINIQFTYDEDTEQVGGILFGDGTLSTIKSELINTVTRTITGASSDYNKLALIGITLDVVDTDEGEYNKLNLVIDDDGADDNDLMDYLETNFDDVKKLFIASGSSPYSNLTYISHTDDTEGGAYNVTISTAATRGTTTGSKALGGTITGADETVTLTDFDTGRVATVDLTVGMDIDDVVNAINSEFAQEYTEQLTGANGDAGLTSSTLFNDALVGGENNDVITFSGTRRNGLSVSGSYTISDATTETVGDLLEAIEDMYEDGVTVALDGDGKIVITDTQAGDSQLAFTIDTDAVDSLNFGAVSTTTEGRYAMTITASKTVGNELLLTHNTYGTGQQVATTSVGDDDELGLNTATKVWGENVAGTINSLTATGSGQNLSLDSDGNNADGLSISYTGTSTIAETTFTLTLGMGELMDRRLGFITNTSDGYVTYKKTSLGNSIDSFETQIENMEAQLNRKMETMINRFVAMELALAKIQNQGQWLAAQISGSFSGWGSL